MIAGQFGSVFVYGRIKNLSRESISATLVNAGGRLVAKPEQADTIVLARSTLDRCVQAGGQLSPPFISDPSSSWISETALVRRLRDPVGDAAGSPYSIEDVSRLSGLAISACTTLSIFDVIGKGERLFSYADLAAARQIARLSAEGIAVPLIIRAAWTLHGKGMDLARVKLLAAPWGEIVEQVGGQIARLDGQYALVLDAASETSGDYFAKGVESEAEDELDDAERWYRLAMKADRRNPLAVYNLGNVLLAFGREAESLIAYQQALAIDPDFAEAAFNLARLLESRGQIDRALILYGETVEKHPKYAQAIYNFARLLTLTRRFQEALPLWGKFIAMAPSDEHMPHARQGAVLCRMELKGAADA